MMHDNELNDQLDDIALMLKKGARITFWAFWLIFFLSLIGIIVGTFLEQLGFSIYM